MELFHDLTSLPPGLRQSRPLVALGNFDGLHRGHQQLIQSLVAAARAAGPGAKAMVLSFYPHPMQVLFQEKFNLLITVNRKARLMASLGVDGLICLPFTPELARMAAEAFVTDILWDRLQPREVFVGFNFTFGHRGAGTPELLHELGQHLDFIVHIIPPVKVDGQVVSSSTIRRVIAAGDIEAATRFLGYHPVLEGEVVPGAGRGREIGFPTANVRVAPEIILPPDGVYAVRVHARGAGWDGVMNIGLRPTFGRFTDRSVEVYLIDFSGGLYGEYLELEIYSRLRGERKFASSDQLVDQIRQDVELARIRLASAP